MEVKGKGTRQLAAPLENSPRHRRVIDADKDHFEAKRQARADPTNAAQQKC